MGLAACSAIRRAARWLYPYPAAPMHHLVGVCFLARPGWLELGRSTLADALFQLGEPDDYSPDGRTLGWVNINRLGGGVLVVRGGW